LFNTFLLAIIECEWLIGVFGGREKQLVSKSANNDVKNILK